MLVFRFERRSVDSRKESGMRKLGLLAILLGCVGLAVPGCSSKVDTPAAEETKAAEDTAKDAAKEDGTKDDAAKAETKPK